jgi:NitT/TauT family transport system ATP-binding protein
MINVKNLNKQFHNQIIFDNLSLTFEENKVNLITGPSGCGKTTLLKLIAGLDQDYTGTIENIPEKIAYVFQEDRLLPWMSVEENIRFVLKSIMEASQAIEITQQYLHGVHLYDHRDKYPSQLSGGMQRRVAIARAFAYPSTLLLMDEPFTGLDEVLKNELIGTFLELQNQVHKTTLLVTHDLTIIESIGDKIITLKG